MIKAVEELELRLRVLHEVDGLQPEDGELNQLLQVKFPIITKEIE